MVRGQVGQYRLLGCFETLKVSSVTAADRRRCISRQLSFQQSCCAHLTLTIYQTMAGAPHNHQEGDLLRLAASEIIPGPGVPPGRCKERHLLPISSRGRPRLAPWA